MLCLSLFPTFPPSNFVRVIDSSVPCALAFWLCFVTPHLYQLAWFQLGGLSNFKKKTKKTPNLGGVVAQFPPAVSAQPRPPLRPCTGVSLTVLCVMHPLCPQDTMGAEGRAGTAGREDEDAVRVSTPGSFCPGRASPALALISGTSRAPLSLRQRQGSSRECRVGGAAMYK